MKGALRAADVWGSTSKWGSYPCDVFLGAHSWFFNLTGKYAKMKANPRVNPWIDAAGYKKYVAEVGELRANLIADQTAAGPPAPRGGWLSASRPVFFRAANTDGCGLYLQPAVNIDRLRC